MNFNEGLKINVSESENPFTKTADDLITRSKDELKAGFLSRETIAEILRMRNELREIQDVAPGVQPALARLGNILAENESKKEKK